MNFEAFDSSYFCGISHFEDNGTQNYLVSQPVSRYFKTIANINKVTAWKSEGLFDEGIKPPSTSDNSLNTRVNYIDNAKTLDRNFYNKKK